MVEAGLTIHPDSGFRAVWEKYEARQGRKAWPREIGDAAVLLCSPQMSLVNAHNLVCDKYVESPVAGLCPWCSVC